jgi:ABC-type phosphate transport system substrate-binding protein
MRNLKKTILKCVAFALALVALGLASAGVAVIGHPNVPKLDEQTVQKLYTGKLIEIGGMSATAVNAQISSTARASFLKTYLNQDEEKYSAYWTVRRYIGKGNPPRELASSSEIINFVKSTPGAIGYVDETEVKPGLNVLIRK